MLKSLIGERGRDVRPNRRFATISVAMLILSLHWALVLYIHSTYLKAFVSDQVIGTLFVVGSGITVVALLFISRILEKVGNYKLTLWLSGVEFLVLVGMGFAHSPFLAILLFILHQAVVPLILFNLDVFIENIEGDEKKTGGRRGFMLTIMSLATALAPLGTGFILKETNEHFGSVYLVSALFLLPFAYLIWVYFRNFPDVRHHHANIRTGIRSFWHNKDLRFVFSAHFLLQLFFAWMVIYVPLYLATVVGFGWDEIGSILFVGLLAYVLLEYPIGRMADFIGEKEMMGIGFFIMAIATCWISFIATPAVIPWMVTMFLTRVGASFVEATTESYFFKHTTGLDANIISFFRITRPLAMLIGALLGSLALFYMPFQYIFVALGLSMLLGIIFSFFLQDTR